MQNELIQSHSDEMTATAARIVAGERAAMVAPFVNSIMPALSRMCENHIRILVEFEQIEVPDALSGADMEIDIVSPMAMQARGHEVAAMIEAISYITQLAQLNPDAIAALDIEASLTVISDATGTENIIDLAKYKKFLEEKKAQATADAAMQQEMAMAQTAKTEAEAVKTVGMAG